MEIREIKEKEVVVGYTCDVCGGDCNLSQDKRADGTEVATLKAHWGYWSRRDCTASECHLCENCFDRVVEFIESIGGRVREEEVSPWAASAEGVFKKEGRDFFYSHKW